MKIGTAVLALTMVGGFLASCADEVAKKKTTTTTTYSQPAEPKIVEEKTTTELVPAE